MNNLNLPPYSLPITFLFLCAIMVLRYFLVCGLFLWMIKKINPPALDNTPLNLLQKRRDIRWSILSSLVFAASGVVMVRLVQWGESRVYLNFSDYPLWYLPVSFILYLFVQDSYFYWTHRLMHKVGFRTIHLAHHESRSPSAWTSFAFHPWEALIQSLILPLMIVVIPVHLGVLGLFLFTMSAFGVTNHLGVEIYPRFLERSLGVITARHHHIHHQNLKKNFGLFFNFWDRLMGTEQDG